ncbi:hypothetical protein SLEP1_g44288 [Rubroshorea leprosula]|uniref:Uncharacterized protein n=1 Tax=Rubroshorea leprosula TaxID=152421 RepID=A0AAV5LGC5_9ROSI|nr:hypothetical protein SLEP1_g44288 [Rubroshorea leprosula]
MVFQVLAGLDSEYSVAKRTIPQRNPFPSFLELHSLLLLEEATLLLEAANRDTQLVIASSNPQLLHLSHHPHATTNLPTPPVSSIASWDTFSGSRGHFWGNRGRSYGGHRRHGISTGSGCGFDFSGGHNAVPSRVLLTLLPTPSIPAGGSQHYPISCQLCQQLNHQARDCPLLTIWPTPASPSPHPTLFASSPNSSWYIDSGCEKVLEAIGFVVVDEIGKMGRIGDAEPVRLKIEGHWIPLEIGIGLSREVIEELDIGAGDTDIGGGEEIDSVDMGKTQDRQHIKQEEKETLEDAWCWT